MTRILLVNIVLAGRGGTEVVTCETARGLRRRGHEVVLFGPQLGTTAEELASDGFLVVADLAQVPWIPEIIQANQTYPLLQAVSRFPDTPCLSICHDATVWYNEPLDLSPIRVHAAVDLACRDRIVRRFPRLEGSVILLPNAVDLDRLQRRGTLPVRPQRALVVTKNTAHLPAIRTACDARGIQLDMLGPGVGREVTDLAERWKTYDLVFATARTAIEAMAAGCSVIVVDGRGFAGLVTERVVGEWRDNNFGARLLERDVTADTILREIVRYDAADAARVCTFIRKHSSLEDYLTKLETIYSSMLARHEPLDPAKLTAELGLATADLVSVLQTHLSAFQTHIQALTHQVESLQQQLRQSNGLRAWAVKSLPPPVKALLKKLLRRT